MARVQQQGMVIEFTHPELGQEVQARAGYYIPMEEHVLPYNEREVIYVLGYACLENPCCSAGTSWGYIQVPGFLIKKHIRSKGTASPVSEVEIIQNEGDRNNIRRSLLEKYPGAQVEIWGMQYGQEQSTHSSPTSKGSS